MSRTIHQVFAGKPGRNHFPQTPKTTLLTSFTSTFEPGLVIWQDLDDVLGLDHAELHVATHQLISQGPDIYQLLPLYTVLTMQHPLVPVSSLFTITVSVSLIQLMGLIPHQPILIVTKLTTSLNHVIGKFYLSLHLLDTIRLGLGEFTSETQSRQSLANQRASFGWRTNQKPRFRPDFVSTASRKWTRPALHPARDPSGLWTASGETD